MSTLAITPLQGPIQASIHIPGSKSFTNRALIMAALTKGAVTLHNPLYSTDTEAMIACLRTLGLRIDTTPDAIVVHDAIDCIEEGSYELFAHDSGTTARFMLALLCMVPGIKTLKGSSRLNARPIKELVDALRELGALIDYCGQEGELPVRISSSTLSGHTVHLNGAVSSQFCSALLLIAPCLEQGLTIHLTTPLISKPYVEMTVACMQEWGVDVIAYERRYIIPHGQKYKKHHYMIEGDFSSAGYFFALAALTRSTFIIDNLNPHSLQADRKFLEILAKMGNGVSSHDNGIKFEGKRLVAQNHDMEECPDQVMTMAVLAAFAEGVTTISGVRSLRVKESERVVALRNELGKMGIKTEDSHDTLTIYGGKPCGATIDTYNDHRIAMAFAIAGAHLPGIVINHPEVVNKTFPDFWDVLTGISNSQLGYS